MRLVAASFAALVFVLATPGATDSARWWHSPRTAIPLRLTVAQVRALDRIYDQMVAESRACALRSRQTREAAERLLASDASATSLDAAAAAHADATSDARRRRTLRLYDMFQVLTPEQRQLLGRLATNAGEADSPLWPRQ